MLVRLCNAPTIFQRLMKRCMGDFNFQECLSFLDDIVIFSKTFKEAVLQRLHKHGLKLKPSKCELFRSPVVYLVYLVSKEGIHMDPS